VQSWEPQGEGLPVNDEDEKEKQKEKYVNQRVRCYTVKREGGEGEDFGRLKGLSSDRLEGP